MANKLYEESAIQDIADAIRSKNGSSDTYTVSEMSNAIENIPSGGGDIGEYYELNAINNANNIKDFIKKIPDLNAGTSTTMDSGFSGMKMLEEIGTITALSCSNFSFAFYNNPMLTKIKGLQTSLSLKNVSNMFRNSPKLTEIPPFDTSGVTRAQNMFYSCSALTKVPEFNFSSITDINNMSYMFDSVYKLTDESLDNILKSCISAGTTGALSSLGFTAARYNASRIQALPHYQDFIDAGWSIGY